MSKKKIRVLVCDDHLIVRQGIKQILADADDIEVVCEAANGPDAIRLVREPQAKIDVVLLDIAMPQRDGLDMLKQFKSEFPKLPVLILSTYSDKQYAVFSLKLGAAGYLNKSADSEQMIAAIRKVATGSVFITPSVAELLAASVGAGPAQNEDKPIEAVLSQREHQVYRLLSQGMSVGEIAIELALAPNTVSTYRSRILEKTGVRNDVELALFAVRQAGNSQ
ncbi:MAG TPA: response regulator transcription factor [Rhodocyclaceae bacterium]|jgi:DNA-binding NarL/FixJ family response regulator|nr:response regulator transcription factor [Rhodocyclaceae bacterium]